MKHPFSTNDPISRVKSFVLCGALLWTIILGASLVWNIVYTKNQTLTKADLMARLTFDKDMTFRTWVTFHGGVYVPVTDETTPNPYLNIPGRDETLRSGKPVTLMNPAYVLRQYYEKFPVQKVISPALSPFVLKTGPTRGKKKPSAPLKPERKR